MASRRWPARASVLLAALAISSGCSAVGLLLGVGQPEELRGDIPFRVTNPRTPPGRNFSEAQPYSVCKFMVTTQDGRFKGQSWFGGTAAPSPGPGEFKDFKIKPGVYRIQAIACMGDPTKTHEASRGHLDIEVKGPTEIVIVAPTGQAPNEPTSGYDTRALRTGTWKHESVLLCHDRGTREHCEEW